MCHRQHLRERERERERDQRGLKSERCGQLGLEHVTKNKKKKKLKPTKTSAQYVLSESKIHEGSPIMLLFLTTYTK